MVKKELTVPKLRTLKFWLILLFTDGAYSVWQCGREVGHQMYVIFCSVVDGINVLVF